LAVRSQGPGFKSVAVISAAVLAVGVGTAVVGFGGAGASKLHQANGPGAGGGAGPSAGPSAAARLRALRAHGAGHAIGPAQGPGSGPGGRGGTLSQGPVGCHNPDGSTDQGVTANSITIVMPIPNLSQFEAALATASPSNSSEDEGQSIKAFTNYINNHGGINCRKLNVLTPTYDPGQDSSMASVCTQYTRDRKVFAWIDGLGSWHDFEQLCVAQTGNTPLISSWTGTTQQFLPGRPNLWWTGPDMCSVIRNLVHWSVAKGKLTPKTRFGIVYTTSQTDVQGYKYCLLPALRREGLKPTDTGQMDYSTQPNQSQAGAAAIVSRFNAPPDNIRTVIPMLPFYQFESWLTASSSQNYVPRLLLSDYDQMFQVALTLVGESGSGNRPFPTPYTNQLQDQQGPTYLVLGNPDSPPYASPLGQFCDNAWHATYKPTSDKPNIEATGTAMDTCQNLELFATAASMAGNNLTRAGLNAALGRLTNFNGGVVPNLRFGGGRWAGPHLYRIVAVHNNTDDACPKKYTPKNGWYNQGNCWLIKSGWSEEQLA
jgi:hypothetical protein